MSAEILGPSLRILNMVAKEKREENHLTQNPTLSIQMHSLRIRKSAIAIQIGIVVEGSPKVKQSDFQRK